MTVTREEFDAALTNLRELEQVVAQNTADLKVQFERIAQLQLELDRNRLASEERSGKKKSTPLPQAAAADRPHERRSMPR
jgi:hypothetical protein